MVNKLNHILNKALDKSCPVAKARSIDPNNLFPINHGDFGPGFLLEIIELALKVNSKAGKAIIHVKTTAQMNVQNADAAAQHRDKAVRVRSELHPDTLSIDATLIEFREWLTTFKSYFHGSNLQNNHINGQQAIYKQLLDMELRRRHTGLHTKPEPQ